MAKRITFHRTQPRLWRGNGMGTEPAHYEVRRGGVKIGTLTPSVAYGWSARIDDAPNAPWRINCDKLAEAKAAVIHEYFKDEPLTASAPLPPQTRPEQLADAYIAVARVNHYMIGIVETVTDDERDEAEQILIRLQNKTGGTDPTHDLALDLLENDRRMARENTEFR